MKFRTLLFLLLATAFSLNASAKQTQPDPKRQAQIRAALASHGFQPGKNWRETQEVLRQIARDHHWQHQHAPDARVLILLGLGNPHSNPAVLDMPPSILEPGILAEYKPEF